MNEGNEHNGRHLDRDSICEECLEFRLGWSAAGAKYAVLQEVEATLMRIAGEHFQSGMDGLAHELRSIAKTVFGKQKAEASKELGKFITSSSAD